MLLSKARRIILFLSTLVTGLLIWGTYHFHTIQLGVEAQSPRFGAGTDHIARAQMSQTTAANLISPRQYANRALADDARMPYIQVPTYPLSVFQSEYHRKPR